MQVYITRYVKFLLWGYLEHETLSWLHGEQNPSQKNKKQNTLPIMHKMYIITSNNIFFKHSH